jgi:hypothetical protein
MFPMPSTDPIPTEITPIEREDPLRPERFGGNDE